MPQGSHTPKMDYPLVKMVQFSGEAYAQGIEVVRADHVELRVYGVAKTIADCFKHRNKIATGCGHRNLKEALAANKCTANDMWRFAKICSVADVMQPYLGNPPDKPKAPEVEFSKKEVLSEEVEIYR